MRNTAYGKSDPTVSGIPVQVLYQQKQAAEYSNIGINKIGSMLKQPNCPFVLYAGTKKPVKRKESEAYISGSLVI